MLTRITKQFISKSQRFLIVVDLKISKSEFATFKVSDDVQLIKSLQNSPIISSFDKLTIKGFVDLNYFFSNSKLYCNDDIYEFHVCLSIVINTLLVCYFNNFIFIIPMLISCAYFTIKQNYIRTRKMFINTNNHFKSSYKI
jgi:hypothetical protein